jgi:uncharacterized membrane protein YgdD (TMEM256/DUF423 family)
MTTAKLFVGLGACSGLLAVVFGAFGAHALRARLDAHLMGVFETAVQYHMYHSLALVAAGLLAIVSPDLPLLRNAGLLFLTGVVLFSGSLYLLALTGQRWLGAVTPLGGLAFVAGWACLAVAAWQGLE